MISWERVNELRDEVGEDGMAEVVPLFLEEMEGKINGLTGREPASDMADSLHFLKGSAANLGFDALVTLLAAQEAAAVSGQPVDLSRLRAAYAKSKVQFLSGLDRVGLGGPKSDLAVDRAQVAGGQHIVH